jgi:hypothetical protein
MLEKKTSGTAWLDENTEGLVIDWTESPSGRWFPAYVFGSFNSNFW